MQKMMLRSFCLIVLQVAAFAYTWPQDGNLVGFWPLDSAHQFKDVRYNRGPGSGNQLAVSAMPGPFGMPNTCVVPTGGSPGADLFSTDSHYLTSFTVSFLYYTTTANKGDSTSAIVSLSYALQYNIMAITSNNKLYIETSGGSRTFDVGIQTNTWNFIAVTYTDNCRAVVYNSAGYVDDQLVGCSSLTCGLWILPLDCHIKFAYNLGNLMAGDAVACVMVYKSDLSASEVAQLPHECYLQNPPTCTPNCVHGSCIAYNNCSCTAGWTGVDCNIPICSSACQNGGTCTAPNTCTCTSSWTGGVCTIPVCTPSCQNGGTCYAPDSCQCTINWNGTRCEIPVCAPSCQNGGTCTFPGVCSCNAHWTGGICTIPVCSPNCINGGTCIAPDTCACTWSWNGTICEIPVCNPSCKNGGECISPNVCNCTAQWSGSLCTIPICNPGCLHGGNCYNPGQCQCTLGWSGGICEEPVCNPGCQNGGTCSNPHTCTCDTTWMGDICEIPICTSPCQNGGTCSAPDTCSCTSSWNGTTCEIPICTSPCQNGATCSAPNTCTCATGWAGATCQNPICSPTCQNGGTCSSPGTCTCASGWNGPSCTIPICSSSCQNSGTCTAPDTCACTTSWNGTTCAIPVCSPSCQNGGTCSSPSTCSCTSSWTGSTCQNPVCGSPCQNGGTCSAPDVCTCATGWTGATCATPVCTPSCQHGGTCSAPNTCTCATGWTGTSCQTAICNPPCQNGMSCVAPDTCDCAAGWTGATCGIPICTIQCQNGGTCTNPETCTCAAGWTGTACETPICNPLCQHGGTCSAPYTCTCAAGWTGTTCGTPICDPNCQNGGTCTAPNTCLCTSAWSGPICTDPCGPACLHGGTCIAMNTCACTSGWNGTICDNPLCSSPCQHGGTCSAPNTCTCPAGWTGSLCQTPICSQFCHNGGTCTAPDVCTCATGWTGTSCSTPTCADPCQHGGTCIAPNVCACTTQWNGPTCQNPICNSPMCASTGNCTAPNVCTCSAGWTSSNCGKPICSPSCVNGGTCALPQTCVCPAGYTGNICQSPICYCQNGATCVAPNTCHCASGYTGGNCTIPICHVPCQHGGTCIKPDKCACPIDWQGDTCNITTALPTQASPISISYLGKVDDNVLLKYQDQLQTIVNATSESILSNPEPETVAQSAVNFMESLSAIMQRYDAIADTVPLQNLSTAFVQSADAVMAAAMNGTESDDAALPDYFPDIKACPNETATTEEYASTPAPQPVKLDEDKQKQLYAGFNAFIKATISTAKKTLKPGDTFRFNGSFFAVSVMNIALENIPGLQIATQFAIVRFPFVIPPDEHFADFDPNLDPSTTYIMLTVVSYIQNMENTEVPTNMAAVSLNAEYDGKPLVLNKENPLTIILTPLVKKQQRFSTQKVFAQCDVSKITCDLTTNADTIGSLASLPILTGSGDFMLLFPVIPLNYTAFIAINAIPTGSAYNWSVTVTETDFKLKSNTKLPDLELHLKKGKEFRAKIKQATIDTVLGKDGSSGRVYVYMKKDLSKYGALDDLPAAACDLQHCFAYHLHVEKTKSSTRRKRQSADDEDTLELSPSSNEAAAQFSSNYFGDYGANLAIPPNTIEFSDIFANFTSLLEDNYAVLAFQVGGIAFFVAGIVVAAIFDHQDIKAWAFLPIASNQPDQENNYLVSVNHYKVRHYGQLPKVSIRLLGDNNDTPWRLLDDQRRKNFEGKRPANFILTTYMPVGLLEAIELLVESPEPIPDNKKPMQIYIDKVIVIDVLESRKYIFPVRTKMYPNIAERVLLATEDEIKGFRYLVNTHCRVGFTDSHPWLSVLQRPLPSSWTRAERIGCVVSALFMAMLVNAMFYGKEATSPRVGVKIGNFFRISWFTLWTSVVGSAIIVPPTTIIAFIFNKIRRRSGERSAMLNIFNVPVAQYDPKDEDKVAKKFNLPFFCVIFAWILVGACIGVSAFFVFMYSLSWGKEKSLQWLSSIIMHIIQDIMIIQTVKVVILSLVRSSVLNLPDDGLNIGRMTYAARNQDTQQNTELFVRFRNMTGSIIHHVVYVIAFALIIATIRSPYSYLQVRDLKPIVTMNDYQPVIDPIKDYDVIFYWLQNQLVPSFTNGNQIFYGGIYKAANMYAVPNHDVALIGPIRLRQQRVATASCPLQSALYGSRFAKGLAENTTKPCQNTYIDTLGYGDTSERRSFSLSWQESAVITTALDDESKFEPTELAWIYRTTDGPPYIGKQANYKTGGYYVDLPPRMAKAQAILADLQKLRWLDNATSVVFVDFILYNAQISNLFVSVKIVFEALSSGGMNYHTIIYPLSLYQYSGADSTATLAIQGLWAFILLSHIVKMLRNIKKNGWKQFRQDGWNLFEMCELTVGLAIIGLFVARILVIIDTINAMKNNHASFTNLDMLAYWDDVMYNLYGIAFFMTMLLFFRHLTTNKYWAIFLGTLSKGKVDILGFVVVLAFITMLFAGLGHLILGSLYSEFQSFGAAVMTLIQNVIGVTGSMMGLSYSSKFIMAFCTAYSAVVTFLSVQIFMAIISRTYTFVADDVVGNTIWDVDLSEYMSSEWKRLLPNSEAEETTNDNKEKQEATRDDFENLEFALEQIERFADEFLSEQSKRERMTFTRTKTEPSISKLAPRRSKIERELSAKAFYRPRSASCPQSGLGSATPDDTRILVENYAAYIYGEHQSDRLMAVTLVE